MSPRYLIVLDRHPGISCLLAAGLGHAGHVLWTVNEFTTLRAMLQAPPDVLILDASLEGIHWPVVAEAARRKGPCVLIAVVPSERADLLRRLANAGIDRVFPPAELGNLLREATAGVDANETRLPWALPNAHVDRALHYLASHVSATVTVGAVAAAIGLSPSHLAHVFAAVLGATVKECALRLKVELVKHLLLNTRSTLEDLADRCGFADASHLSRVFHHFTGLWPGEFRQRSVG
jgi:AraC-like DNA-binding protein